MQKKKKKETNCKTFNWEFIKNRYNSINERFT